MKATNSDQLIHQTYRTYHDQLVRFICKKVNNQDDAYDIAQDVFVRLLEYQVSIQEDNARNLVFTIASNLINDYLRHLYVKNDVHTQILATSDSLSEDTEQNVIGRDLARLEIKKLASMPKQRRIIYRMRIHEGKSSQEVAYALNISRRTAENHYYLGLNQMRDYFRACV